MLVLGQFLDTSKQLSEFELYVGYDTDYVNNNPCPDGPFAYPLTNQFGTKNRGTNWVNGVEAYCHLEGMYVSFVR